MEAVVFQLFVDNSIFTTLHESLTDALTKHDWDHLQIEIQIFKRVTDRNYCFVEVEPMTHFMQ